MGKKSVKENKNVYHIAREECGLTRSQASELMGFVSADKIDKIENEKSVPHPEEVLAMSEAYKDPSLCNYYCSNECPIGKEFVPEVKIKSLAQITLEMIASLNVLEQEKNRLIEITVDGQISDDEMADFSRIQEQLSQISMAIDSLQLWVRKSIANGKIETEE